MGVEPDDGGPGCVEPCDRPETGVAVAREDQRQAARLPRGGDLTGEFAVELEDAAYLMSLRGLGHIHDLHVVSGAGEAVWEAPSPMSSSGPLPMPTALTPRWNGTLISVTSLTDESRSVPPPFTAR
jgi:hypothetical protein